MTEFESYLSGIAKLVGYLSAIYVFIRLVLTDWNKKKKDLQQAKIEAEHDSHEPIMQKMDEMEEKILEEVDRVKKDVEKIQRRQEDERSLNRLVAQLSLATADEMGERGQVNGKTIRAKEALRAELLSRA